MFRSAVINGHQQDNADCGNCEIYEYPESKPNEVYFDGAECEFYEKADDRPLALIMGVAVGDALGRAGGVQKARNILCDGYAGLRHA